MLLAKANRAAAVRGILPLCRGFSSTGRFHSLSKFSDAVLERPFRRSFLGEVDSIVPKDPSQVPADLL
jgi:hypothetical protein